MIPEPKPKRNQDTQRFINSPGPGRPIGSRNKLADRFLKDLLADFNEHGVAAIESVRASDPVAYLRIIASLLPRQITGEDGGPVIAAVTYRWADPPTFEPDAALEPNGNP